MVKNSKTHYGSAARGFHWAIALLIFAAFILGIVGDNMPRNGDTVARLKSIYSLHKTIGVSIFFVAVARIIWAIIQPRPVPLHPDRKLESFIAEFIHWALYGALVLMPLSGWIVHAAEVGFAPILWPFGQGLPFVAKSEMIAKTAGSIHGLSAKIIFATVALHILGAVKHVIIDRDDVMARMTSGRAAGDPDAPTSIPHYVPFIAAILLWTAVVTAALSVGELEHDHEHDHAGGHDAQIETGPATPLSDQNAENIWTVETGSIGIEVIQMGAEISGGFDNWQAEISYDPDSQTGAVSVVIDTRSLQLGGVTDQAKGSEFFDTNIFATAVFSGPISQDPDGQLQVIGELELIGNTAPVTLIFNLEIDDDLAKMSGHTTLDRRDFSMGVGYPTESDVGFHVGVSVDLVARR